MKPESGWFISRIRKMAPDTDNAQRSSMMMTVALRGANRPKLKWSIVSQKTSITRNVVGKAF